MTRVMLFSAALTLMPALAAGQTAPLPMPAPPGWRTAQAAPPPVPQVAPVPPVPLLPSVMQAPPVPVPPLPPVPPSPLLGVVPPSAAQWIGSHEAELARLQVEHALLDRQFHLEPNWDFQQAFAFATQSGANGEYRNGLSLLDRGQYDQAIQRFDRAIAQKTSSADGALYWKAFAQFKLGRTDDAIATLALLRRDYDKSGYLADARILEADARRRAGQPVDLAAAASDDQILLYALSGLVNSDPARAVPLISEVLGKTNSMRVKGQALYLLALSDQPQAHQTLLNYAKGGGNPDIQRKAIEYLASSRRRQTTSAELLEIYGTTTDQSIKMTIISAFAATRNAPALMGVANSSAPLVVRQSAISGLTNLVSPQELWTLYQKEEARELRLHMVSVFSAMGAVDQLAQIAKTDRDPGVRQRAIRSLGGQKAEKTGTLLVDSYTPELDRESKNAIVSALGAQNNADGLVAIARKETNIEMRTAIVSKLVSLAPKSKAAQDYLAEIIRR